MQFLYFSVAIIALIAWTVLGISPEEQKVKLDRDTIAMHMSVWHKGAVRRCHDVGCTTGTVDPLSHMPATMRDGDAFSVERFITRFDSASKLLVTAAQADLDDRSGVSFDVIMSGLNAKMDGESSQIGIYNRANRRVDFTALTGIYRTISLDIPDSMASDIPDGSPVIVSTI